MLKLQREAIGQGATLEDAKAAAAKELGVPVEQIIFEVLQQPQKKTLGLFGGADAKVLGTVKLTPAEVAENYLQEILNAMDVTDVTVSNQVEQSGCVLTITGENLGFLIGRRGATLDALQYLVSLAGNRASEEYYRIMLNVGDYREKRSQSLSGLAKKYGNQVARTRKKVSLEPMNPYERRIIHTVIHDMKGVTSWSVGTELNRHVVIAPSEDNTRSDENKNRTGKKSKPRREKSRSGGDKATRSQRSNEPTVAPGRPARKIREFIPRSNPLPTADGATPPAKTESETESTAALYGRIDL